LPYARASSGTPHSGLMASPQPESTRLPASKERRRTLPEFGLRFTDPAAGSAYLVQHSPFTVPPKGRSVLGSFQTAAPHALVHAEAPVLRLARL
jgi:hypothetical protein